MNTLYVGFEKCDITPPLGTVLSGYQGGRTGDVLHDRLSANAIAFRQNNQVALLISLDLLCLSDGVFNELKEHIVSETGIPGENIIASAIHTHSGPCTMSVAGWNNVDRDYVENILYPKVAHITKSAIEKMQPAKMGIGQVMSYVGINRREILEDGSVALGQSENGVFDPKMYVLSFCNADEEIIVNLIHYGAHATATWETHDITRDWPGYMVDRLEEHTSAPAVFFNGAIGDIGPRLSNGKTTGDLKLAEEIGRKAGEDAVLAFQSVKAYEDVDLSVKNGVLKLPYCPLISRNEAEKRYEEVCAMDKSIDFVITLIDKYKKILEFYDSGETPQTEWAYQQTYIAIGPVVFVPYPAEIFCQIALDQQKMSPFTYTLCLSNANGYVGYLPTEDQIPYGGYEIESFYSRFYQLEDCADKQIVQENQRLLEELFR